jgi:hypothetical protein
MKSRIFIVAAALLAAAALTIGTLPAPSVAQESAAQVRFIKHGVQSQGFGVYQVGELSTLSAEVASATLTEVVAAPSSGSIYLRGIWINKSTTGTGSILIRYGTGTNCGTGTTTLMQLTAASGQTFPFGYVPIGVAVPAAKALCLSTDAATTGVRALTN